MSSLPAPASDASIDDVERPERLTLDVVVTRGGLVESRHRVHAAVVRHDGALLATAHDPQRMTWWRSCAKPFQVMPMLRDGTFDRLGWGDEELALACASHGSEPEHVAVAARMLAGAGLQEADLACGPHEPLSARGAQLLREAGRSPGRLHSNCSGKHAAMAVSAKAHGWPVSGYEQASHPVQQAALAAVAEWAGVPATDIPSSVDGCGVPVFALPLHAMALAYARLAEATRRGDAVPARIVHAMTRHAHLVGGTGRFDTLLMDTGEGRIVAKIGAEGVHSVGLVDRGIGLAVKVEDGAARAVPGGDRLPAGARGTAAAAAGLAAVARASVRDQHARRDGGGGVRARTRAGAAVTRSGMAGMRPAAIR